MSGNGWGGAREGSGRRVVAVRDHARGEIPKDELLALGPAEPLTKPRWKKDPAAVVGFSPSHLRQLQRKAGSRKRKAGHEAKAFEEFCREYLIQSVDSWDGEPFRFYPDQRRFLREALRYSGEGHAEWRSAVFLVARKNGKTTLLAAYALWRLLTSNGSPQILLTASSDKQADRLFEAAMDFVNESPILGELLRVRDREGEIIREDGRGVILRRSSDPKGLHGYNPSLVICDELAQWTTPKLRKAYAALTTGGGARSAPQVFTITTAGMAHEWEESILGGICRAAKDHPETEHRDGLYVARMEEAEMLAWIYEAPTNDPTDIAAMKKANPAPWITTEYLRRQAANPELSDADVLQLHGCVWAENEDTWISPDVIDRQIEEAEVPAGARIVIGFDGSYRRDATALIGCTLEGHVFTIRVWERPESATEEWRVPRNEVHATVSEAMEHYDVVELAPDPPGWHAEIEEWEDTYGDVVVRFDTNQRARMCPATDRFSSAMNEGQLTLDGSPVLVRHITNCITKETPSGTVLSKSDNSHKIDAAVAAVVAYDRASYHANAKPASPRLVSLAEV